MKPINCYIIPGGYHPPAFGGNRSKLFLFALAVSSIRSGFPLRLPSFGYVKMGAGKFTLVTDGGGTPSSVLEHIDTCITVDNLSRYSPSVSSSLRRDYERSSIKLIKIIALKFYLLSGNQ